MRTFIAITFVSLAALAFAAPDASFAEQVAAGKRLISLSEDGPPVWMTEQQVESLVHQDLIHFMDITDQPEPPLVNHRKGIFDFPSQLFYQRVVGQITPRLSVPRMELFVAELASFHNRYYNNQNGVESSAWLQQLVQSNIDSALGQGYGGNVTVHAVSHDWPQNSVVARIEGSDPVQRAQVIVLGAHQDSINSGSPTAGQAPGADDDGSGCAVLLESLRAILESGFVPRRTLEFQWYAAEEVGLRGSQAIANDYNARGVEVISMMNFDVVGYSLGRRTIGVITDFTDAAANQFLRDIIDEYSEYSWTNDVCGYACSDHASYYRAGYPAVYASEIDLHPAMHTVRDTIDTVNFEQVLEFAKVAVGHSVELGLSTL